MAFARYGLSKQGKGIFSPNGKALKPGPKSAPPMNRACRRLPLLPTVVVTLVIATEVRGNRPKVAPSEPAGSRHRKQPSNRRRDA